MELFALPLFTRVGRQTNGWHFPQCPFFVIDGFQTPKTIHNRITNSTSVRSSYRLSIVGLLIAVTVASGAGRKCCFTCLEVNAFVFGVAFNTANAGSLVWFDYGRDESIRLMTFRASFLDLPFPGMTRSTRALIWSGGDRRGQSHHARRMPFR